MVAGRGIVAGAVAASLGVAGLLALRAGETPAAGVIVFTQVPASPTETPAGGTGAAPRYPAGSRIVFFDPLEPDRGVRPLTEEFHAARAPALSSDGTRMVFSAQREAGGPWQIWEVDVGGRRPALIAAVEGATDPAFLADGSVVFSAPAAPGAAEPHALFTVGSEGGAPARISFHPGDDAAPIVLRDGRLLYVTRESATSSVSRLMTVRADGTAAELFYENRDGSRQSGRAWETSDGQVVFIEQVRSGPRDPRTSDSEKPGSAGHAIDAADSEAPDGQLIAISERRPLHSRVDLRAGLDGSFRSVAPLTPGEYLVSYRPPGRERYGLYVLEPASGHLEPILNPEPDFDAVEPIVAVARPAPKRFESVVDLERDTGELYCLDADHSDLPVDRPPGPTASSVSNLPSVSVRIRSAYGVLGEVPLEEDGSFYVELPADTPVRLETIDGLGHVVRGPSAWLWVRPNERRGCIGCHEDRELAPENRVPRAVEQPPVDLTAAAAPAASGGRPRSVEVGR